MVHHKFKINEQGVRRRIKKGPRYKNGMKEGMKKMREKKHKIYSPIVEPADDHDGAERFLLGDVHVVFYVAEDGGFQEISRPLKPFSTVFDFGPFFLS